MIDSGYGPVYYGCFWLMLDMDQYIMSWCWVWANVLYVILIDAGYGSEYEW